MSPSPSRCDNCNSVTVSLWQGPGAQYYAVSSFESSRIMHMRLPSYSCVRERAREVLIHWSGQSRSHGASQTRSQHVHPRWQNIRMAQGILHDRSIPPFSVSVSVQCVVRNAQCIAFAHVTTHNKRKHVPVLPPPDEDDHDRHRTSETDRPACCQQSLATATGTGIHADSAMRTVKKNDGARCVAEAPAPFGLDL